MLWPRAWLRLFILPSLLLFFTPAVQAHPHNWITLDSQFVLAEGARLVQIKQRWEFDVYYSMMTLADMRNEYDDASVGLRSLASQMIDNLAEHHYFSSLRINNADATLGAPSDYRLSVSKKEGQDTLVLEMSFDLPGKPKLSGGALSWRVFDPTYYIAMMHINESNVGLINLSTSECEKQLSIPEPSEELLGYAESLDRSQTDTDGLGANFAETVLIQCR